MDQSEQPEAVPRPSERQLRAEEIARRNTMWAMGVGVIPVPIVDLIGISAVQVKLLGQLSDLYDIPFSEHQGKNLIAALLGGLGTVTGAGLLMSLLKVFPVLGHAGAFVATPIVAGAATHALGKIFIQHFEAGGTILDFEPEKVRAYFRQEFEKAKATVRDLARKA